MTLPDNIVSLLRSSFMEDRILAFNLIWELKPEFLEYLKDNYNYLEHAGEFLFKKYIDNSRSSKLLFFDIEGECFFLGENSEMCFAGRTENFNDTIKLEK